MIDLISIAKDWARDPALMGALEPVVAAATITMFISAIGLIVAVGAVVIEKKRLIGVSLGAVSIVAFFALGLFVFTYAYAYHYHEDRFGCPTFETQRYVIERGE